MRGPLSYIVFHPDREVAEVTARVLKTGSVQPEARRLRIWMDNVEGNHDPCVLTDPWFYSYCHATQMRRNEMDAGSILFFYDHSSRVFDTVLVVRRRHMWTRRRPRSPPIPIAVNLAPSTARLAWDLHFKWPSKGYHENAAQSFEAAAWPEERFSFLPMHRKRPVSPSVLSLPWLDRALSARNYGKRPLALSRGEADSLFRALRRAADTLVVGGIGLVNKRDIVRIGIDPHASTRR